MKMVWLTAILGMVASPAMAQTSDLVRYEFQGQPGTETSVAPSYAVAGLTGINFTETAVTPSPAANSISASGFTNPAASFNFGFGVTAGYAALVNQIVLATRSSGTGPGFLSVLASVDGGAFQTVGSITQAGTNYNDEVLGITPMTAFSSVTFRIIPTNQTSASGGTVANAGTFRVGDYDPAAAPSPTPFTLRGRRPTTYVHYAT